MKRENKYRILILTDHSIHSPVESIYSIARGLFQHEQCAHVHAVTRASEGSLEFFQNPRDIPLQAVAVSDSFQYSPSGRTWNQNTFQVSPQDYDVYFLRLPRSNSMHFFEKIGDLISPQKIINQPIGIIETGSKEYLLEVSQLCPPIRLCRSLEDIKQFAARFPIVVKPLNNSGGKGIIRIEGSHVWNGMEECSFPEILPLLEEGLQGGYLAMKYLKNVTQGDKRVIVVNGEIVAAALRIPAADSWLCNVSQGASSNSAEVAPEEIEMAEVLSPRLLKKGVVLYGFDTLTDDTGKRVLSEINTSCVNGIFPADLHSGKPVVKRTVQLFWEYILTNIELN